MHPLKNYYFVVGSILYLLVQLARKLKLKIPNFINSYLTDFLFIPLLLFFTVWIIRVLKRDQSLKLSISMLISAWVMVSFIFEYYLPQKSNIYVADKVDVMMYLLGTISFYFLQKKVR